MTRVPPSGGGPPKAPQLTRPSSKSGAPQTSRPAGGAPAARPRRIGSPKHLEKEKPAKLKTGSDAEAEGAQEAKPAEAGTPEGGPRDAHEHAKLVEAWQPESHADKAEEKKAKDELHEEEKAHAEGETQHPKGFLKQIRPALKAPSSPLQQKKAKDGFEGQQGSMLKNAPNPQQTAAARALVPQAPVKPVTAVHAAAQVQAPQPPVPAPRPSRPPDAFSVLHAAQDPGVYFKEEGHNGPAESGNPELTAAIEEAIRLLFGVRGILRVSGGFNQADEPAIIIVTTQGFGEASMKLIPPKVHRFETILAVPYDMLPLKRDRPLP